ncbi:MAG: DUF2442 domain-containing protein [Pseudomonadota bacterium]
MFHVRSVRHIAAYKVWVSFDDGTEGEIDLEGCFDGPMFEPLKQVETFARLSVDPELETIVWPNGADLAPEFLKELHTQQSS